MIRSRDSRRHLSRCSGSPPRCRTNCAPLSRQFGAWERSACAAHATPPTTDSAISNMLEETDRLSRLVERLLFLSKGDTGQIAGLCTSSCAISDSWLRV